MQQNRSCKVSDLENFKQQVRAWTVNRNKEHVKNQLAV